VRGERAGGGRGKVRPTENVGVKKKRDQKKKKGQSKASTGQKLTAITRSTGKGGEHPSDKGGSLSWEKNPEQKDQVPSITDS